MTIPCTQIPDIACEGLQAQQPAQQINARELLPPVFTTVTRWQKNR